MGNRLKTRKYGKGKGNENEVVEKAVDAGSAVQKPMRRRRRQAKSAELDDGRSSSVSKRNSVSPISFKDELEPLAASQSIEKKVNY